MLISSEVHGQSSALRWLRDFRDQPLRPPQSNESEPWPKFVKWHTHEVFRKPALRQTPGIPGLESANTLIGQIKA